MSDVPQLTDAKRKLLEKYLGGSGPGRAEAQIQIPPRPSKSFAPLSFPQEQVWLHSQLAPAGLPVYNETLTIHRHGPLNVSAVRRSLTEIVRRHEIWRTTFDVIDLQPVQIVHPPATDFEMPIVDLRKVIESSRQKDAMRLASDEARRPFDLKAGPLLRAILVQHSDNEYRLFMTFHQLIFDGVTAYQVFLPEFISIYEAFVQNRPVPLPEPGVQYADYAVWQKSRLNTESLSSQLDYWRRTLAGTPQSLDWPQDRPRPPVQTHRGEILNAALPNDLVSHLKTLGQAERTSLFMTLVAGLGALLHRYTGQDDLILGTPTAGRSMPQLEHALGYFLNFLPLRIDLSGNPTFRETLGRVRNTVFDALSCDDVPFTTLVEKLRPAADPSRNPFFQVAISLEPAITFAASGWSATQSDVPTGASKLDLYIDVDETPNGIAGPVAYNPDIFDAGTIARLVGHWRTLLGAAVADPDRKISELPILTPGERHQVVTGPVLASAGQPSIHDLFSEQCSRKPNAVALTHNGINFTFSQVEDRSDGLAGYLTALGVLPQARVAVCAERSLATIVALLAILKIGATYVPLDPNHPAERLNFLLQDAQPAVLLTQRKLARKFSDQPLKQVLLDEGWESNLPAGSAAATSIDPDQAAYLIYTSGSTGVPRGVLGTHRAAINRFAWMWERFPFQPGEVCCHKTN
ncbi:MAG TPA: condensation domain-containing protein, partial [Terriglobales bacterium]|nr:condensation domain-containing protein [Terriglobales bacterium]